MFSGAPRRQPGSEPWGRRPAVVLAITSNLELAAFRRNVRLRKGEANLRKASVVNVTQIATVDRDLLGARLGTLSRDRLAQVWEGVRLVCEPG